MTIVAEGSQPPIVIIGCGNTNRQDDAVGVMILRRLMNDPRLADPRVKLLDAGTDGMGAMFAARGCRSLFIIDACRTGADAGAVFEVPGCEVERESPPDQNLHAFRWDNALYAGRKMFRQNFPQDVMVYLIEAEQTGYGFEISTVVEKASLFVQRRIGEAVLERLAQYA